MDIENIAQIDFYLRCKNGRQNLLDIDYLIIADNDSQAVNKLKDSAYRLNDFDSSIDKEEIRITWQNLFTKQIRYSVTRAKNKRKSNNS